MEGRKRQRVREMKEKERDIISVERQMSERNGGGRDRET